MAVKLCPVFFIVLLQNERVSIGIAECCLVRVYQMGLGGIPDSG